MANAPTGYKTQPIGEREKGLPQRALAQIRTLCRGNGIESDSVQIKSATGEVIECEAITHIELHPEFITEQAKGRVQKGEVFQDAAALQGAIDKYIADGLKGKDARKYLANLLLERPDKGFSLHAEYFDAPPMNKDYCCQNQCGDCAGQGKTACAACGGRMQETCPKCHGRRMIPCDYCNSAGFMRGADGKQTQCPRCFGKRQVGCNLCAQRGTVPCRGCKGAGTNKCQTCGGAGFTTDIVHLKMQIKTLFELDRTTLPHPATKMIENHGTKLAAGGHIKLKAEQVRREDGGLALHYDFTFPYGDLNFTINGKEFKTHLFGYKGKMLKMPDFLDGFIEPQLDLLHLAITESKKPQSVIMKASKTRIIGLGLLYNTQYPPKKTMMALKRKFPFGVSKNAIQEIAILCHKALKKMTRKNRWSGIIAGGALAVLLYGVYFLVPLPELTIRGQALAAFTAKALNSSIIYGLDLALVGLAGFIGTRISMVLAKRPLLRLLRPLMDDKQRKNFKPKTQGEAWVNYLMAAGVMAVFHGALLFGLM